jgi:amino acid transporter|tara:strand:+ start:174 stop:635 length:462 start_codon:yes stop_codon:yes gene_type:complete
MDMSTDNLDIMQFFVSMLIVGIGVALLATGIFTSYFGAGKSQKIGFALLFLGTITLVLVIDMAFGTIGVMPDQFAETNDDDDPLFTDALVSGVSALAGMIIGMFTILFVLMKVDTVDDLEDLDLEDLEDLDLDEELKKLEEELNQADSSEVKE